LICAAKNRTESLLVSINSWIQFKEISEFLIIDWSSDRELSFLSTLDPRIKIIRVDGQKYYSVSKALNLAIKNAKSDWIIKMDCDYILNPYYNFFENYNISNNDFLTGSWRDDNLDGKKGFLQYLNGFIFTFKENLSKIGGYNENFRGYGWEDCDLYLRLANIGVNRLYLNHNDMSIFHIPHQDFKRGENYECSDIMKTLIENQKVSNYE
jgi:hypothetical protein